MIAALRTYYISHATIVAYMLQSTEYQVGPYLKWYWRTNNFAKVMHRRKFDPTRRGRLLRAGVRVGMILQILLGITLVTAGVQNSGYLYLLCFGIALLLSYPVVWAHAVVLPLLLAKWLIVLPSQRRLIAESEKIFAKHPGTKIGVVGSYGKTSMKEMLATVLGHGLNVAATPANKNVAISHAQFAQSLHGNEDALVIEYGEGAPGDVSRFAQITHPSLAIITGLAPAHLDKYKTLDAAAKDIFSVADFVAPDQVYVNGESPAVKNFLQSGFHVYDRQGVNGWKVSDVSVDLDGTKFKLRKGNKKLALQTKLLGRHQIGPLCVVAVLAMQLGLTDQQVQAGITETHPFEHRMYPYRLGGATIIDDTYNGNLEGVKAGTALLNEIQAKRKWYVTPGLVEQGKETAQIHTELGRMIADSGADIVVLMKNSVTDYIQQGIRQKEWQGELRIEHHPLDFYTHLEHFVAYGDVVLMQNDWTDNYA